MKFCRHQPRRLAGGDRRAARAPLVRGRAIPPRIQIQAHEPQPLFAGFIGAAVARNKTRNDRSAAKKPTEKPEKIQEPQKTQSPNPSPT